MENASIYEVLQLAISLEEEGTKFYQNWASQAQGSVKETLEGLALDEVKHADYFKNLFESLKNKPAVDYLFNEEVTAYFKSYVASAAFNRDQIKLNSIKDALEEGILTEKKSIEYYEFLSKYSKEPTQKMLEKIIAEEKEHLVVLEKLLTEV